MKYILTAIVFFIVGVGAAVITIVSNKEWRPLIIRQIPAGEPSAIYTIPVLSKCMSKVETQLKKQLSALGITNLERKFFALAPESLAGYDSVLNVSVKSVKDDLLLEAIDVQINSECKDIPSN